MLEFRHGYYMNNKTIEMYYFVISRVQMGNKILQSLLSVFDKQAFPGSLEYWNYI